MASRVHCHRSPSSEIFEPEARRDRQSGWWHFVGDEWHHECTVIEVQVVRFSVLRWPAMIISHQAGITLSAIAKSHLQGARHDEARATTTCEGPRRGPCVRAVVEFAFNMGGAARFGTSGFAVCAVCTP